MGSADAPDWQPSRSSTSQSMAEGADDLMGDDLTEDKGFQGGRLADQEDGGAPGALVLAGGHKPSLVPL